MPSLEALTREASALAANQPLEGTVMSGAEGEASRILQICNACRYCEGFCAVFPAMTHRLEFGRADVHFLANLCHNCSACLYACQYAPPHEFAVNVPATLAQVRQETYVDYAWPAALGSLYKRNGLTLSVALAGGLALFICLLLALNGALVPKGLGASFYAVFPHNLLALLFGAVFLLAILALGIGVRRFWRNQAPGAISGSAAFDATHDALTLRYLGGGHGQGCNTADDAFSLARRRFHHLTFYGFLLCFTATCVATLYHYLLNLEAPYALDSVPVVLGTLGGLGLLIGPLGLLYLNLKRNPEQTDVKQRPMDLGFIALLLLTSASGLALLGYRNGQAMPALLAVHLGIVLALFATLPYGKFAHGIYRSAALLKWALEKRQPSKLTD